jgi:ABC-type transport system involved in multi-copper enzyme maturation permease subunit
LSDNACMTLFGPLFWYELRRLPRRRQMHLWRMLYAGALLIGLVVVYLRMFRDVPPLEALANPGRLDRAGYAAFADSFLMAFLAVQQIAVIVLTPICAAGSIADEKERRTLDFLLSSPLSRLQIVFGKVCSRLVFIASILAAGLPVLMLTMLFGGVDLEHLLAGFAVSAITAVFFANVGVLLACLKANLRETLPGMAVALLTPALLGLCGRCLPAFSAVSPITVMVELFREWLANEPTADSTGTLVGATVLWHAVFSMILFAISVTELGKEVSERPGTGVETAAPGAFVPIQTLAPTIRRTYGVRPLRYEDDPLLWKETNFRLPWYDPERGCAYFVLLMSLAGFTFIAMVTFFVAMAKDLAEKRPLGDTTRSAALAVLPAAAALWPAFLGARAAASLGRERAAQTLQSLFTLPGDRIDILKAIAGSLLFRDRGAMGFLGAVAILGLATGGIYFPFALAATVLLIGCAAWAIAFGIWLSVQVETPARASLIFLAVWGGVLLVPWLVAAVFPPDVRTRVEMLCPPYGLSNVLVTTRNAKADDELAALEALVVGIAMLALAAGLAWHAARTFEREGK